MVKQDSAVFGDENGPQGGRGCRTEMDRFCEEWLDSKRERVRESTYVKYDSILRKHVLPFLGGCPPEEIGTRQIEAFREELTEEGLSPKTVKDVLVVWKQIRNYIYREYPGRLAREEVVYPKQTDADTRILTMGEQRRLLMYLTTDMDHGKFGVLLALFTGMRIGEVCALRWESVSCEERTIHVCQTVQRIKIIRREAGISSAGGGTGARTCVLLSAPKSRRSNRVIPMPEVLTGLFRQMRPADPSAYVLTGTDRFMEPRAMQYRLKRYMRECGLEGVHFHTLRHTFATHSVEAGVELKCLSEILGHSSPAITISRYVHTSMRFKMENMEKYENAVIQKP